MAETPVSTPSLNNSIVSSVPHFITVKLNIDNYLLWKAHIVPFLRGHHLLEFVDDSAPKPSSILDGKTNPAYTRWLQQDSLIISAINSSLAESVLAQVLDCTSSAELWSTLQSLFSAKSTTHVFHTQYQLATLKKGSESITEYFNKAKALASSLGVGGHALSDSQFSVFLLAGLGTEYESLITSLTTRPDPISIHQLYSFLLNHESRLAHQSTSLLSGTTFAANSTSAPRPPVNSSAPHGRGNFRGGRRGRNGFRGAFSGPRGPTPTSSRPVRQVCRKPGHYATTCYYRFDHSYQASPPPFFTANYTSLPSPPPTNNTWFPDTAATHHFTADPNNLTMDSMSYQGPDQVSIGDGSTLPIHNIGSSQMTTPTGNFSLNSILHVPSISRNLLSVRQFCHDNNVFF
ncbi:hypothetical protein F2P56_015863 [Juglans regia]|uniref:Retrovirus-related Pol polyprotein from transposon TNT 1-94-like beta-barrel domain-containing protein n=1 Tax=Juglans regia TaxID=51240 RepID=A0A833XGV8_JUGRE|nr:hypothetical protein F2P56_015863 [Juglans regia]